MGKNLINLILTVKFKLKKILKLKSMKKLEKKL